MSKGDFLKKRKRKLVYDKDNKFIGLGVVQNNILKRDIVL